VDRNSIDKNPDSTVKNPRKQAVPDDHVDLWSIAIQNNWQPSSQNDLTAFSAQMDSAARAEAEARFCRMILAVLHFQTLPDREDSIPGAHAKTLSWLFDEDSQAQDGHTHVSITRWLRDQHDSIYWITGKPGSGKSTLMKYLYHNQSLPILLSDWSEPHKLVTAGFYFWNSGSTVQMSLVGLLRTLLHTCLSKDDASVATTMHERWQQFLAFGGGRDDFSEAELCRMFERVLSDNSRRFFFLIDGLDEFEGEPDRIIRFILDTARGNVKLCVASRPWLAFEDAFKQRPSLLVQDLTKNDIAVYVASHFEHNDHFKHLQAFDPIAASAILQGLVLKASGVFLWVHLAVQSLLEGLQNSDKLSDLHTRLDSLPEDLEALFRNLLNRLSPNYFRLACKTFRLLHAFRKLLDASGPTLLALYYADDDDPKSSLHNCEKHPESRARVESIMSRRLNARCKGFIEAIPEELNGTKRVVFLHRPARDFVESDSYWPTVLKSTGNDSFESDRHWTNSLLWLERFPRSIYQRFTMQDFITCVHAIEVRTGLVQMSYLDGYQFIIDNREDNVDVMRIDYAKIQSLWGHCGNVQDLDGYMALALEKTIGRPENRITALEGTPTAAPSNFNGLYRQLRVYYNTPPKWRWLRRHPTLPRYE
jgi:hypothetical protein